ncbi:sialoadhesin-like [Halichoeres trimaculatus]|uniref:sialoadhesin-like n=1 Tax=Halichoeres trimaculatus TaxID=147232 RepID=UPI003D9F9F68
MAGWDKRLLWDMVFLFLGAAGQRVVYPPPVCGIKGSTVTLPCTFTPNDTVIQDGKVYPIKIVRVRWCQNHEICQGKTPSVYDSDPTEENSSPQNNNPRYTYLGDKRSNCTLQIRELQKQDEGTLRFRMEADRSKGHFTERSGVNVTVADLVKMKIRSSRSGGEVTEGENFSLTCTSVCTFHQLEVTWFKNGQVLPETGPVLRLTPLTAMHSGNYSCALKTNGRTQSLPFSLKVERQGQKNHLPLIVGGVCALLLVLFILSVVLYVFKRRRSAEKEQSTVGGDVETKDPDHVYSDVLLTSDPQGGSPPQETSPPVEDVSYAFIQFTHQNRDRAVEQVEDPVIYSSLASRG